jgi:hypothetical protein
VAVAIISMIADNISHERFANGILELSSLT